MPTWWQKFRARCYYIEYYFREIAKRYLLIAPGQAELPPFLSDHQSEAVFPIGFEERKLIRLSEHCFSCSLCSLKCEAIQLGSAPPSFEPKILVTALLRSASEAEFLLDEWLPCTRCNRCTVTCPSNVPIHAIAEKSRSRMKAVGFRTRERI